MDELMAVSPIDGRYHEKVKDVETYYSEFALIKKRVFVELEYLKELGKGDFLKIHDEFTLEDAKRVKEIEKKCNHDVKAVEYFLREKLPKDKWSFIHYGLTSEDINNLTYSLLTKDFTLYYLDRIGTLNSKIKEIAAANKTLPMLARTHGQPASPTTLGKEFFVFFKRLEKQIKNLRDIKLTGKLNGATGNFSALHFAEPHKDWAAFSAKFIERLGLEPNLITTQIEPKDTLVELFQNIKRINNIIMDLDRDIWFYISYGYFTIKKVDEETGSSTMPHKVNPIDFENSEGNLKIANALFTSFEDLQISRLQRDLSDSTVMRNIGVAFSHSLLAYGSTLKGLEKIKPNLKIIEQDLINHPEVLGEAIQTMLRKYGDESAYEKLKEFSRGKDITLILFREFIQELNLPQEEKSRLLSLEPKDFVGLSEKLVDLG